MHLLCLMKENVGTYQLIGKLMQQIYQIPMKWLNDLTTGTVY